MEGRHLPRLLLLLSAGALLLIAGACDHKTVLDDVNEGNVQEPRRGPDGSTTITVRTAKGESDVTQGGAAALPHGLAFYPGGTISASTRITGDTVEANGTILTFETADTPDKVVAFYKASALQSGYLIEGEVTMPTMMMLTGRLPGKAGFTLTATRQGGKTSVTILGGAGRR